MSIVLGIESSCDETAAAIVSMGSDVLSSVVTSQIDRHQIFGGVVPEVAAREHLLAIAPVVSQALAEASLTLKEVDAIAVTQGPGLVGALLVGISYAKGLAAGSGLPLIPVSHVHAHVHGALLGIDASFEDVFPCLALVVSGGHTNLYYMESAIDFNLVAYSIDDACGESFDKVGKLLGLPYPGGPHIERLARDGNRQRFAMPRMVDDQSKLLFSYSGLKTYMVNLRHRLGVQMEEPQVVQDLCAGFQDEALGQIVRKLTAARKRFKSAKSVLIAGGVAANQRFRDLMQAGLDIPVLFPQLRYCSDNAAMIAALGFHELINAGANNTSQFLDYSWDAFSRYGY